MRKKILISCVSIMVLFGVGLASIPFLKSMNPSEKAKAARSQHDISSLKPGDYIFENFGRGSAWDEKVLIVRDWDGSIYSFLLPTEEGKVTMPDTRW